MTAVTETQEVQLKLPARPESVAVVRHALAGIGDTLAVEPTVMSDMKTAVTEACNNVVVHAYPEAEGTLEVNARPSEERLTVTVRDHGSGMQPRTSAPEESSLGLGLPLIAALSDRFEIQGGTGLGIAVTMIFGLIEKASDPAEESDETRHSTEVPLETTPEMPPPDSPGDSAPQPDVTIRSAGLSITPGPMVAPVLARVTAMLAARADFSLDRLSDAVLVSDAVSAHVEAFISGSNVDVSMSDGGGTLDMRVGPLVNGGANQLLATMTVPGLERSLENLTDEVKIEKPAGGDEPEDGEEYLLLTIARM